MANPGDSPQATRRRVWRFVCGSLFVVAVVGLWPIKGYKIDKDRFLTSLGPPYFGGSYHNGFPKDPPDDGRAVGGIWSVWTPMDCRDVFELQRREASLGTAYLERSGNGLTYFEGIDSNALSWSLTDREDSKDSFVGFVWHHRNVVVRATIAFGDRPLGRSPEQTVRDALGVVRDGIDREIAGVTTFYNPPAKQLWHDRVRPFFGKRFPKWVPPRPVFIEEPAP